VWFLYSKADSYVMGARSDSNVKMHEYSIRTWHTCLYKWNIERQNLRVNDPFVCVDIRFVGSADIKKRALGDCNVSFIHPSQNLFCGVSLHCYLCAMATSKSLAPNAFRRSDGPINVVEEQEKRRLTSRHQSCWQYAATAQQPLCRRVQ
jgi:hypothetical protein